MARMQVLLSYFRSFASCCSWGGEYRTFAVHGWLLDGVVQANRLPEPTDAQEKVLVVTECY